MKGIVDHASKAYIFSLHAIHSSSIMTGFIRTWRRYKHSVTSYCSFSFKSWHFWFKFRRGVIPTWSRHWAYNSKGSRSRSNIYLILLPKWAKQLIEAAGDGAGDPYDKRRTRSQYQKESAALSHIDPLLYGRYFMMLGLDPQYFKEAFHYPRWQEAMDEEFDLLHDNQTWELVSLPLGRKMVQCKWIYKKK